MTHKFLFLFALLSIFSLQAKAQKFYYEGGYFEKKGKKWYEYKPSQKKEAWNWFDEVDDQPDWYVIDNGNCQVGIPKKPNTNFLLKYKGHTEWIFLYKPKASTTTQTTSSASGRQTCKVCDGSGSVKCFACNGKGGSPCLTCHGTAQIYGPIQTMYGLTYGYKPCFCAPNKGIIKCNGCFGSGKTSCYMCNGKGSYTEAELAVYARNNQEAAKVYREIREGNENLNKRLREQEKQQERDKINARRNCSKCHGSRIDPTPTTAQPISQMIGHFHNGDHKCSYCGKISKHWHSKCTGCLLLY